MLGLCAIAIAACNPSSSPATASAEPSALPAPAPLAAVEAAAPASADKLRVTAAEQDVDALSSIRTERLRAKAEGRVLVVYVSATWCEPCKRLKEEIAKGSLDGRLGRTTLLAFDADRDIDRLSAAGYRFQFVPYVALPGPDGRPADVQQASGKGGGAWRELLGKLEAWQREALAP